MGMEYADVYVQLVASVDTARGQINHMEETLGDEIHCSTIGRIYAVASLPDETE